MKTRIRIGCGAGFSGDRFDPSVVLVDQGNLDYLVLECLAERTIGLAQKRKLQDPNAGYDPLLERRMDSLLEILLQRKVKLITNMGAANPVAAAQKIISIARERSVAVKVAALTGDDVLDVIDTSGPAMETGKSLSSSGKIISANAYLGADGIVEALKTGADIIITGRVADPSLFIAPMIHEFGWPFDDYSLMGKGTVIGHLMECAGHITGGYYADPGKKDVPGMANLGHPIADVFADGMAAISKVEGTGGIINLDTAKEQLLYEVVNPYEYFTPDVIADFTSVKLKQTGKDIVSVSGGSGKERPSTFKVSVGYNAFWIGEGEITYAGSNAVGRARLAGDIVLERLKDCVADIRVDLIGQSSVHGDSFHKDREPYEVRLRVAAKAHDLKTATLVGEEVEALYTNGPAGGGGVKKYVNEVIGIISTLLPRDKAPFKVTLFTT
jgi:Acyclic terpene utilisation family protein AtuA